MHLQPWKIVVIKCIFIIPTTSSLLDPWKPLLAAAKRPAYKKFKRIIIWGVPLHQIPAPRRIRTTTARTPKFFSSQCLCLPLFAYVWQGNHLQVLYPLLNIRPHEPIISDRRGAYQNLWFFLCIFYRANKCTRSAYPGLWESALFFLLSIVPVQ